MNLRNKLVIGFYVVLVIIGSLVFLQFFTSLNPVGIITDNTKTYFGFVMDYNIPQTIFPFAYPPTLTVVAAPAISCTISGSLVGITDSGAQIILSTGSQQNVSPTRTYDLTGGNYGKNIVQLQVKSNLYCPATASYSYPNLASGSTNIYWIAYKKDGTMVTILSDKKNIQVPNLPANIGGQTVTLYTWTVTKSQIESAIGANPLGDDFYSSNIIGITDNLVFYQGSATAIPWTVTNAAISEMSTRLHEQINPAVTTPSLAPMSLQMISPTDGNINLQAYRVIKMQASITNWSASAGNPQLELFYTDPTSTSTNSPILNAYLTADPLTSGSSCTSTLLQQCTGTVTTFTYNYVFSSTASIGRYTFELHQNGNPSVPKVNVYVSSSAPPTPNPTPPTPTPTPNPQPLPPPTTQPPTTPSNELTCTPPLTNQNGVCLPPVDINGWITIIYQNIFWIFAGLIAFGITYHVLNTKRGGKGLVIEQE